MGDFCINNIFSVICFTRRTTTLFHKFVGLVVDYRLSNYYMIMIEYTLSCVMTKCQMNLGIELFCVEVVAFTWLVTIASLILLICDPCLFAPHICFALVETLFSCPMNMFRSSLLCWYGVL